MFNNPNKVCYSIWCFNHKKHFSSKSFIGISNGHSKIVKFLNILYNILVSLQNKRFYFLMDKKKGIKEGKKNV